MKLDSVSVDFIAFGLSAAVLSNLNRSRIWRSIVLGVGSMAFLVLLSPDLKLLMPLGAFLLLGYGCLVLLQRGYLKGPGWSVALVILVYAWLKKYTFLPSGTFIQHPYFTLGLSYIFFRVLHLLIETGQAEERARVDLSSYLLYTVNFTTFVSGPIQSYDDFARDQFAQEPIELSPGLVGLQIERIVRGFFKVNVVALLLDAVRVDALTSLSSSLPLPSLLFAGFKLAIIYPFFLYANFSGYMDIVIAIARLMRIHLPENFNRPFSASSFLDFWNRWHITLSTWLKTYVYNPLLITLMRRFTSQSLQAYLGVFCFFVTFFLIGVWHGRTYEFAFFGVLQGAGVAINKLWQIWLSKRLGRKSYKTLAANSVYIAFGRGLTFAWFSFTLFWFWSSWSEIGKVYRELGGLGWLVVWLLVWLGAAVVLTGWERLRAALMSIALGQQPLLTTRYALTVSASAMLIVAVIVSTLLSQAAPPIVYKAF